MWLWGTEALHKGLVVSAPVFWKNSWDGVGRSCRLYGHMFIHFKESLIPPRRRVAIQSAFFQEQEVTNFI